MADEINEKQEAFCREYIKDFNATRAAKAAGYSEDSARSIASTMLTKQNIQARLSQLKSERNERLEIDADWVLEQLKDIHMLDVADILDSYGNFKPITEWPKPWRMYLSGFDIQEIMSEDAATVVRKIKWPDKIKNLELIGKHVAVQAFKDNVKVDATVTHEQFLDELK